MNIKTPFSAKQITGGEKAHSKTNMSNSPQQIFLQPIQYNGM